MRAKELYCTRYRSIPSLFYDISIVIASRTDSRKANNARLGFERDYREYPASRIISRLINTKMTFYRLLFFDIKLYL